MSQSSDSHFIELWNDFLEGELEAEHIAELQQMLSADDRLLKMAADSYQLHRLLGLNAGENRERREAFVRETVSMLPIASEDLIGKVMHKVSPADNSSLRHRWLITAGALAVVAAVLFIAVGSMMMMMQPEANRSIASITGLSGPILWTGDGGRVVSNLQEDVKLNGGTLEGMAPNSWVELTFHDGSTITMAGKSMLTFSEADQKELRLREGSITADVERQPAGKPMLIHTRSAVLEVLGTQFNVEAELSSTRLNVNEGKVRVKRLNDGQEVDVVAQHRVVAAANQSLVPERTPNFVHAWKSDLHQGPQESYGKWLAQTKDEPARLEAIPFFFKPPEESEMEAKTLYLTAVPVSRGDNQPVMVQPNSRFMVRGSVAAGEKVYVGFQVNRANGEFAGKFLAPNLAPDFLTDNAGQNRFQLELQTDDFGLDPSLIKLQDKFPSSPSGLVISAFWCFTLAPDQLELSEVEISSPQ